MGIHSVRIKTSRQTYFDFLFVNWKPIWKVTKQKVAPFIKWSSFSHQSRNFLIKKLFSSIWPIYKFLFVRENTSNTVSCLQKIIRSFKKLSTSQFLRTSETKTDTSLKTRAKCKKKSSFLVDSILFAIVFVAEKLDFVLQLNYFAF